MRGILVDPETGIEVVDFEPELDWYYSRLDCTTIDIVTRRVCGRWVDFICNDEGMLMEEPLPSACDGAGHVMLVGRLLAVWHDNEGNTVGLDDGQVESVMASVATATVCGRRLHLLAGVEYD